MEKKNYKPQDLFEMKEVSSRESGPVTCLGTSFENDDTRRAHFTEELRNKLKDPEFRKIEGFPLGEDEDILKLSDPPYYTACPNPWIADFVQEWEEQKPEKPAGFQYHREPFAADVSEGKNDPIYNAHSYHTKVPHKAIMRYILHYTEPGDIIFDGFCGTGMTGVAAQMCGNQDVVLSLGYQVKLDGTILKEECDEKGKKIWKPFSKLGARKTILNDLAPAATFIANNYNTSVDVKAFESKAKRILDEVESKYGWMYEAIHTDQKTIGCINYTVWSDVFTCTSCQGDVVFLDAAIKDDGSVTSNSFECPSCKAVLSKATAEKRMESVLTHNGILVQRIKKVPVLINYSFMGGKNERIYTKRDKEVLQKVESTAIPEC